MKYTFLKSIKKRKEGHSDGIEWIDQVLYTFIHLRPNCSLEKVISSSSSKIPISFDDDFFIWNFI